MSIKKILSGKIPFVKKLSLSLELKIKEPGELEILLDNKVVFQDNVTSDRNVDIEFVDSDKLEDRKFEVKMQSGSVIAASLKIDNLNITKLLFSENLICIDFLHPLSFDFQTPVYRWLLAHKHVNRLL